MKHRNRSIYAVCSTIALAAIALVTPAAGQQDPSLDPADKAVSKQPLVLAAPGSYFLDRDVVLASGTAIQITSNDITLDLNGHSLRGPGGRQGVGILIQGATNVKVFNGQVRRFGIGVQVVGSTNVEVEGLQIDGIDSGGTPPDVEIGVLLVESRGVRIADNTITDTFLGIFVRGDGSGGNRITNNVVTGGRRGQLGICYNPAPGTTEGGPHGDLVTGNLVSRFRQGMSLSTDSSGNVVRGNTFASFNLGIVEATAGSNVLDANDELEIDRR